MEWANIVRQCQTGRAWADIVEDEEVSVAEVGRPEVGAVVGSDAGADERGENVLSWADVVGPSSRLSWVDVVGKPEPEVGPSDIPNDEPGDPVGIRAVQSILMSATQMSLSHFHTAGMGTSSVSNRQVPSAADAMNSVYNKYNTSMQFDCSDNVYNLRKHIVGARLSSFLLTVGSNLTGLPDMENVWYEVQQRPMYEGNLIRFYIDYKKMQNHGLTLYDLALASFGSNNIVVSPDFMGMIDIEIPNDYLSQWLCKTNIKVCGTFDIQSCDIVGNTAITKGTNILAVLRAPGVDKKTITSNNVKEVEKNFGVEAAAHVLSQLTGSRIVSDFMARTGTVLPFVKSSKEVRNKGLLTSMGFERPKDDIKRYLTASTSSHYTVYESIITGVDPDESFKAMNL